MVLTGFAFIDSFEIVIIMVAVVLLFGPQKLPEIARDLGSFISKFRDASSSIKQEIFKPVENVYNPLKEDFDTQFQEIKDSADSFIEKNMKEVDEVTDEAKNQDQQESDDSTSNDNSQKPLENNSLGSVSRERK
ncbi:MAG: hypothetical protein C4K58_06340 [Flavobacteriaceae bacterium]|nr:MAG: hypothetical protein C4K58_06340 [Flavobacteriaceae bacterium]